MVAKILEGKHEKACGYGLKSDPYGCGAPAVVVIGSTCLCKEHAKYVMGVQNNIDYKTDVGNNRYVSTSKAQFCAEAGFDEN